MVPGLPVPTVVILEWPPHAITPPPRTINRVNMPRIALQRRRRAGMPHSRTHASAVPPIAGQNSFGGSFRATAAVEFTVSVTACAVAPLIEIEAGKLHVAGWFAAVGEMAQLSPTVPVNPLEGVTVTADVFPVAAPAEIVIAAPPVTEKVGFVAAVTLRLTVVEAFV